MSKTFDISGLEVFDTSGLERADEAPKFDTSGLEAFDTKGLEAFEPPPAVTRPIIATKEQDSVMAPRYRNEVPSFLRQPTPEQEAETQATIKGVSDFGGEIGNSLASGRASSDTNLAFVKREAGLSTDAEARKDIAAGLARQAQYPQPLSVQKMQGDLEEADGWLESASVIASSPRAVANVVAQSMAQLPEQIAASIGGAAAGAAAGSLVPGVGTATGMTAGLVAGTAAASFAQEYGNALSETLRDRGIAPSEDNIQRAFQDAEFMSAVREKGVKRGLPIAAMDAVSAGLAGRVLKPVEKALSGGGSRLATTAGATAELGTQAALGAAGEAGAQLLDEGQITSKGDVLLEGIAEIGMSGHEIGIGLLRENVKAGAPGVAAETGLPQGAERGENVIGAEFDVSGLEPVAQAPTVTPQGLRDQANAILAGKRNPTPEELGEAQRLVDEAQALDAAETRPQADPVVAAEPIAPAPVSQVVSAAPTASPEAAPAGDSILLGRLANGHNRSHIDGMTPGLRDGLTAMIQDAPPGIREGLQINSGYRSPERQAEIIAENAQKYGLDRRAWEADVAAMGPEAAGRKWRPQFKASGMSAFIGAPGGSKHQHGQAADLAFNGRRLDSAPPEVRQWVHQNAARYGLHFPLSNEAWHIEVQGSRDGTAPTTEQIVRGGSGAGRLLGGAANGLTASAVGVGDADFASFGAAVAQIEGARYDQMGGSSNRFAGKYQMGDEAITDAARIMEISKPSRAEFLSNPELQESMFDAYTLGNHRTLMRNDRYANASQAEKLQILGYAHNQGAGGAMKWLDTGVAGRDAFGTSGTKYFSAVGAALGSEAPAPTPTTLAGMLQDTRTAKELQAEVTRTAPAEPGALPAATPSGLQAMLDDARTAEEMRRDAALPLPEAQPIATPPAALPAPSPLPAAASPALADTSSLTPPVIAAGTRADPITITPETVNLGAEQTALPTQGQAEAGNYRKRHVKFGGLDVSIETEAGQQRSGIGPNGEPWSVTMPAAYGYIKGTKGADGDHVDVYVGGAPSGMAYVVDQIDAETGKFDEHKIMLGYPNEAAAREAYRQAFSDGRGMARMGAVTPMADVEFNDWLRTGNMSRPVTYRRPRVASGRRGAAGPQDIVQFLAAKGGIRDFRGELGAISLPRFVPGAGPLVRAGGMALDRAREIAEEAGYLGPGQSSVRDLLDLIDQNGRGMRVFSTLDTDRVLDMQRQQADQEDARVRADLDALVKESGARLLDGEISDMLDLVARGESVEDAFVAVIERNAQAFEEQTRPEEQETNADERIPFDDAGRAPEPVQNAAPEGGEREGLERGGQEGGAPAGVEPGRGEQGGSAQEEVAPATSAETAPVAEPADTRNNRAPEAPARRAPSIQKAIPDTPQARRAVNIMGGAKPGDRVTPSAAIGYGEAGQSYTITSVSKKGHVYVTSDTGDTSWTPADMQGAPTRGVTFGRDQVEGSPVSVAREPDRVAETAETVAPASANPPENIQNLSSAEPVADYGTPDAPNVPALARAFADHFAGQGNRFPSIVQARKFAAQLLGSAIQPGTEAAKRADEAIELGVVMAARQIVTDADSAATTFDALVDLYQRQPSLNVRSSTSVANQAYSTPVPLAYVADRLARIDVTTTVYEPTAGNGALLLTAEPSKVIANELDPARADALKAQGFAIVTQEDATTKTTRKVDAVIANPPFGAVREGDRAKRFTVGQLTTGEIDHAISLHALESMKDDGSAVLILGGVNKLAQGEKRSDAYNGKAKREFYFTLYNAYNVVDHFTVSGDLYAKQGAAWPVDVIVIRGRGKSARALPAADVPRILNSWDEIKGLLDVEYAEAARRDDGSVGRSVGGDAGAGARAGDADARQPVRQREPASDGVVERRAADEPDGVRGGPDREQRTDPRPAESDAARRGEPRDAGQDAAADGRRSPLATADDRAAARESVTQTESATETAPALERGEKARTKPAPKDERANTEDRQVAYRPKSQQNGMGTLVPVNMQTTTQDALTDLQKRVGNLDEFVARELGMKPADIGRYFAAEQVDGIALGIDNFSKGAGFIVGDQTGIGKGRQVAGILRWAIRNGKTPIFITEKPNLYADMYRDLVDVGVDEMLGREPKILMTNAGERVPLNEEGTKAITSQGAGPHGQLLKRLTAKGKPEGFDLVFTTYSQMQTVKKAETDRMAFLRAMVQNNGVLVFDEAHNAGGQTARGSAESQSDAPNRAQFARELLGLADAVLYSSATYAKRPDVMDLYAKTDMRLAVDNINDLGELIAKGGVPMQQIVAAMLSQQGQYVRRERSFDGIRYDTPIVPVDRKTYERFSGALAAIQDFSEQHVSEAREGIDKDLKAAAKIASADNATGGAGATSTNFTAIMHNVINQMLLSISADQAADLAIASLKADEKPVITVANTLESFLTEYADEVGAKPGDDIDIGFNGLLERYLERSRILIIKEPHSGKGESKRHRLTDRELGPDGVRAFNAAMKMIRSADFKALPASPVDWIRYRLKEAGYRVGEITGRGTVVDYGPGGKQTLATRPGAERSIAGRRKAITDFNSGRMDVMILNQAGSTGLSLHASEKVSDQRRRHMIIAQAEGNIDTHMQMLGRTNRTGQVIVPRYSQMVADVPAQKRPASVLAKKMASLNASTTASRDSAVTAKDVPDFINAYGDQVARQMMMDNPDIHAQLGKPLAEGKSGLEAEDAMRRVTGRIPLLPIAQQETLYEALENEYQTLMQQLDAAGENGLEAKTLDLDARTIERTQVKEARGDSVFASAVDFEKVSVKQLRKPFSSAQVIENVAAGLGEPVPSGEPTSALATLIRAGRAQQRELLSKTREAAAVYAREVVDTIQNTETRVAAKRRQDELLARWNSIAQNVHVGQPVRIASERFGTLYGVVTSIEGTGKTKNPVALGAWKITVATADASRQITFGFSQVFHSSNRPENAEALPQISGAENVGSMPVIRAFDDMQAERREDRTIVTGNLLAGYDFVHGRGSIINFTDSEGRLRQGILLPKDFAADKFLETRPVPFTTAEQVVQFLERVPNVMVRSSDGFAVVRRAPNGDITIATDAGRGKGGKYFLNRTVLDAAGRDFIKTGGEMAIRVPPPTALRVLDAMRAAGAYFETKSNIDVAKEVTASPRFALPMARFGSNEVVMTSPDSYVATVLADKASAQVNTLEREMRADLKRMGLERVALRIAQSMHHVAEGRGSQLDGMFLVDTITVSLQSEQPQAVMHHEAIHALREFDAFTELEWNTLANKARTDWMARYNIAERYAAFPEDAQIEEAIAAAYQAWASGRTKQAGVIQRLFLRIRDLLAAIARVFRQNGLTKPEDVFRDIRGGKVGQRAQQPRQGETAPMQRASVDGDLFRSEVVETEAGPRRDFMDPTKEGDPQSDPNQILGGETRFAFVREPRTAEDRQRGFKGSLARGQFLDRAFRIPFDFIGGTDEMGQWKPGKYLSEQGARIITRAEFNEEGRFAFMNGALHKARAGLVDRYNLPEGYADRDRARSNDETRILNEGVEILKGLKEANIGVEEAKVLQAILTDRAVSSEDMNKLAEPIRVAIDQLGQEAVSLGLVSREAYERNRGTYLNRSYLKYEQDMDGLARLASRIMGASRKKIIGNQLKGRGIFLDVDFQRLGRDNPLWHAGAIGNPQVGERYRVLDDVATQTADDGTETQRVLKRIFWPANQDVPVKYAGFRDSGIWEVRGVKGEKASLWRDYSKAERTRMGEILDARYLIGKTYLQMSHDLASGRFFKDIAEHPDWSRSGEDVPDESWGEANEKKTMQGDVEWVRVPNTEIAGTGGKKRWGALAGRFVRASIWQDMNEVETARTPRWWRQIVTQWKLNKTVRSPVVHMNNIMSNVMFMDLADIRVRDLSRGIRDYVQGGGDFKAAADAGVFGGDFLSMDVRRNVLKPLLDELATADTGTSNALTARAGLLGKMAGRLWGAAGRIDQGMKDAYRIEDEVFRLAAFISRRDRGATVQEAADFARETFLDYDIRAPWVRAARNTVLPFISYTYRAVPMIAQALAMRPWKLAKYFAVAYALNALAYGLGGDDEEDEKRERGSFREAEKGWTWFGVPRMARMPWRDEHGNPVFLDIRRWIPAGDVFDMGQGQSALPVPAPLQFGGPILLGFEFFLNKQAFTGQPITNDLTDDWMDKAGKVGSWAWKAWVPSAAYIPGSHYNQQLVRAASGAVDPKGRDYSVAQTLASSIGIKLKPQDVEEGYFWQFFEMQKVERELKAEARRLGRMRARNIISQDEFDRGMDRFRDKLANQTRARMELSRQRGAASPDDEEAETE